MMREIKICWDSSNTITTAVPIKIEIPRPPGVNCKGWGVVNEDGVPLDNVVIHSPKDARKLYILITMPINSENCVILREVPNLVDYTNPQHSSLKIGLSDFGFIHNDYTIHNYYNTLQLEETFEGIHIWLDPSGSAWLGYNVPLNNDNITEWVVKVLKSYNASRGLGHVLAFSNNVSSNFMDLTNEIYHGIGGNNDLATWRNSATPGGGFRNTTLFEPYPLSTWLYYKLTTNSDGSLNLLYGKLYFSLSSLGGYYTSDYNATSSDFQYLQMGSGGTSSGEKPTLNMIVKFLIIYHKISDSFTNISFCPYTPIYWIPKPRPVE